MNNEQKKAVIKRIEQIRKEKEEALLKQRQAAENAVPGDYVRCAAWLRKQKKVQEAAMEFILTNWDKNNRTGCGWVVNTLDNYQPIKDKLIAFREAYDAELSGVRADYAARLKRLKDAAANLQVSIMLEDVPEDIISKLTEFSAQDF